MAAGPITASIHEQVSFGLNSHNLHSFEGELIYNLKAKHSQRNSLNVSNSLEQPPISMTQLQHRRLSWPLIHDMISSIANVSLK